MKDNKIKRSLGKKKKIISENVSAMLAQKSQPLLKSTSRRIKKSAKNLRKIRRKILTRKTMKQVKVMM